MKSRICVGALASLLPMFVLAQEPPVRAELSLSSPLGTARSGTPVVVELCYFNRTKDDLIVLDLIDPFLAVTSWKWESASGSRYVVSLADLHFLVLPEPGRPQEILIHSGESYKWYASIPTPSRFGNEPCTLCLSVTDPFRKRTDTAELRFKGSDAELRCVVDKLGPTWAQAAVLELYPTRDVFRQLAEANQMRIVEQCSKSGDRAADLILYARAITQKRDIARRWQGLENAPDEIRCLRNYLLFYPMQYNAGTPSDEDAEALLAAPKESLGRRADRTDQVPQEVLRSFRGSAHAAELLQRYIEPGTVT